MSDEIRENASAGQDVPVEAGADEAIEPVPETLVLRPGPVAREAET
jgi:hypothetical protein